jgi:hypothetical protein
VAQRRFVRSVIMPHRMIRPQVVLSIHENFLSYCL